MRKTFKTIVALVLALVLAASLSATAWADGDSAGGTETGGTTPTVGTATVTITDLVAGEKVVAYKVVSYAEDYHSYAYEATFEAYLKRVAGDGKDISEYFSDQTGASQVKALIENYVAAGSLPTDESYVTEKTVEGNQVEFSLAPGYYIFLVKTTAADSRIYLPMSAFVRVDGDKLDVTGGGNTTGTDNAITLTAKYKDGPTIDKQVWCDVHRRWETQTDAAVGSKVSFYVKVEIPSYTDAVDNINLTIKDTMSNMTYVNEPAKVYKTEPVIVDGVVMNEDVVAGAIPNTPTQSDGIVSFTLDYKSIAHNAAASVVYVYYQAVSGGFDAGIASNSAYLTYKIAAGEEKKTSSKTNYVYNYVFTLNKVNNIDKSLSGAKFSVYTDADCTNILKFNSVQQGQDEIDVVYYPNENGNITEIEANSSFTITGLGSGVYYVKEVSAPKGYFVPTGVFKLELHSYEPLGTATKADHENLSKTHCSFKSMKDEDSELVPTGLQSVDARQYSVTVRNATTPVLPTTGGAGTVMFTVGGVAVMVLAAVLFLKRKREE